MRRDVARNQAATTRFREISSRTVGKELFDGFRADLAVVRSGLSAENDQAGLAMVQDILLAMVNQETG